METQKAHSYTLKKKLLFLEMWMMRKLLTGVTKVF